MTTATATAITIAEKYTAAVVEADQQREQVAASTRPAEREYYWQLEWDARRRAVSLLADHLAVKVTHGSPACAAFLSGVDADKQIAVAIH